jgi:hypothetical protein
MILERAPGIEVAGLLESRHFVFELRFVEVGERLRLVENKIRR